jgi:hypothetical protein
MTTPIWNCCCGCRVGSILLQWPNSTRVRKTVSCSDSTVNTVAPFSRWETGNDYAACSGNPSLFTLVPDDELGPWLLGGDLNGPPTQKSTAGTDDIVACATPDATHATIDHNCYSAPPVVTASSLVSGVTYQIKSTGTTDFTAIGAANNNVGTLFTATGSGSGTGTAQQSVDMRAKLFGAMWILGRKWWHGTPGWLSQDLCLVNPNNTPDTVRYLSVTYKNISAQLISSDYQGSAPIPNTLTETWTCGGTRSVNRLSGIIGSGLLTTYLAHSKGSYYDTDSEAWITYEYDPANISGGVGTLKKLLSLPSGFATQSVNGGYSTWIDGLPALDFHCGNNAKIPASQQGTFNPVWVPGAPGTDAHNMTLDGFVTQWNTNAPSLSGMPTMPAVSDTNNYDSGLVSVTFAAGEISTQTISAHVKWTRTDTDYTFSFKWNRIPNWDEHETFHDVPTQNCTFSGTVSLSDPYSIALLKVDFLDLLAAWDMSDASLWPLVNGKGSMRLDEKLALASLILRDETQQPVSPLGFNFATMPDYAGGLVNDLNGNVPGSTSSTPGQHDGNGLPPSDPNFDGTPVDYITTWAQLAWIDPNNYAWQLPSSWPPTTAGATSATIKTPLRDGSIVSHTKARMPSGSSGVGEKHWWPGCITLKRKPCTSPDPSGYTWINWTYGAYPAAELSPLTMRWLNNFEAQHDGDLCNPDAPLSYGNLPQSWMRELRGALVGGKFVQATQQWLAVNRGRPAAWDKFAVDQTTVCGINSTSSGSFSATPSSTSANPGAVGGIAAGDVIAVDGDGLYPVTSVTGSSAPFTINVGTRIGGLPTGWKINETDYAGGSWPDGMTHLGKLRFPSAPGIGGRAAVTATWAGGTLTITSATAIPTLLKSSPSDTLAVDLYDANMTAGTKIASAALTRVSDTQWTTPRASAPSITIAYMVSAGVDWTKYTSASQKTGVHAEWSFNNRAAQSGFTSPPSWYASTPGCLGATLAQFSYSSGTCDAVVGIVPYYQTPPIGNESFAGNQTLGGAAPVELFPNQELFDFPAALAADDVYGGFWQAGVFMTMPDPFWQTPFKPDCDGSTFVWSMDDGSGQLDVAGGDSVPTQKFYPFHPLVEASTDSTGLPAGIYAAFDPAHNQVAPPYWPLGIPIGDADGNYGAVETEWGFTQRACATIASSGRFATNYANFVTCP